MNLQSVRPRVWMIVFAMTLPESRKCRVSLFAQGGEPRSFAIRGAKVVPVGSTPMENATVVVSRGVITAIGTNVTIPADAWVIEGKGLIVYPGLIDGFTDVGMAPVSNYGREYAEWRCRAAWGDIARTGRSARDHAVAQCCG